MRKPILGLAAMLAALFVGTENTRAFDVIEGQVIEFTSPDDLLLDPAVAVIAVDIYGNGDSTVNGVDFFTDRAGLGTAVTGEGVVTSGAVTVTTNLTNQIDNWANAGGGIPDYGATPDADALEQIMRDIRWANAGAAQTQDVEISGLDAGGMYDVQLLFNEGAAGRDRRWDIAVDGALVVDDFSSYGGDGAWTASNGYAYQGIFTADAGGVINIVMGQEPLPADPNNTAFTGADNNAILQGVIVHSSAPPTAPSDIVLSANTILATAAIGEALGTLSSVDVNGGAHTYALVAGAGDTDNGKFQIVGDELQVNADLTADAGNTLSIRVQSTDDTAMAFEKELQIVVSDDSDSDSLLDSWELDPNFANPVAGLGDLTGLKNGPGPGSDTGDFDGDGCSDAQEFVKGTDPTDPDSDGDGLLDGVETNTGTFVDADDTGTDPLDDDSDDDNINDGDEVAGSNPFNAQSNPLDDDSDDDGLTDDEELTDGADGFITNPANADTDGDGIRDARDSHPTDPNLPEKGDTFAIEYFSPDELFVNGDALLDPSKVLIAVNTYGNEDLDVNGVTFFTDRAGLGAAVGAEGEVTFDGVTVTTSATNLIDGWSGPPPTFTGGSPGSAANLSEILFDIRWEAAPAPLTVDITGLEPGVQYVVDLLTNEGADRNRFWDVGINGVLEFDNYSSEGDATLGHLYTGNNAHGLRSSVAANPSGELNIVMQQDLGGDPPTPTDNNPILCAVVVRKAGPAVDQYQFQIKGVGNNLEFSWNSFQSDVYDILTTTDPEANPDPNTWDVFLADILPTPDRNVLTEPRPGDAERYFALRRKDPPPLVVFDFESDEGWIFGAAANPPDAGNTVWERGMPTNPFGPPTGADGSANCLATNLASNYNIGTHIFARSPVIDLTGVTGAKLTFQHFRGLEDGFDFGYVRVFQASDNTPLGPEPFSHPTATIDGVFGTTGVGSDWESEEVPLSPEMLGKEIYVEFYFLADEFGNDAGWHIDNVEIQLSE